MPQSETARRDAWREANRATTVTGRKVQPEPAPREGIHEDHAPAPSVVTHPANAAPESGADRYANVLVDHADDDVARNDAHRQGSPGTTATGDPAARYAATPNTDGTTAEGEPVTTGEVTDGTE